MVGNHKIPRNRHIAKDGQQNGNQPNRENRFVLVSNTKRPKCTVFCINNIWFPHVNDSKEKEEKEDGKRYLVRNDKPFAKHSIISP